MYGGRVHVYVCLYVRGGLESRQRRDGEEREKNGILTSQQIVADLINKV